MQKSKAKAKVSRTSLSGSTDLRELAEFWDTHDVTDFDEQTHEVDIEFDIKSSRHYVAIDPELMEQVGEAAESRGLSSQSLVNLWIKERLVKH